MPCQHKYLKKSEEQDLFKGKATRKLTINRHKMSYLAELLVENASHQTSELTDIQIEARSLRFDVEKEKYSVRLFANELRKHDSTSESYLNLVKEFTTHYITIYDKLFFFGSLLASKRMSYHVQRQGERTAMYEALTIPVVGPDNQVVRTKIEIYIEPEPGYTTEEQTRGWLGTLAHEVLHSFLLIFGCCWCYTALKQAGPRGHGHAWQAAAYEIEIACVRLLSNNVRLGRWTSLSFDVENHGMSMPEESLLRKWNMIGPEDYAQTPEVPESAKKTDHDKREGTGKSVERAPPYKDDKVERRDPPRKDEKRDPPRRDEKSNHPCKDDKVERRDPPRKDEKRDPPRKDERRDPPYRDERRDPPRRDEKRDPPRRDERRDPSHRDERRDTPYRDERRDTPYRDERRDPPRRDEKRDPPRKDEKRDPPRKDERRDPPRRDERRDPSHRDETYNPPHKNERRDPPYRDEKSNPPRKDNKIGRRDPLRKDNTVERRDLTRSQPNEENDSSRNTSRQDLTPATEKKPSRKPDPPKRRTPLG
ncbi:hypothetical protein BHYA_0058g00220 [Botrytis hyacinthi]|uniref:SprT-like domain-containing protein n=1 Tax=Botrytis hyacinthi TaxID=278943 RepID=A0A4Z1GVY0_9HELO|nr:hypothetical protein BHYA_0058g00220 [Botrytis hyacinthi]